MSVHMRGAGLISWNAPADSLRGHGHGSRHSLDGRDQLRDYLPFAVVVRVKNEPHYTAANIFDFGEAGNKYIRHAEWFRQICRHLSLQSRTVNAAPGNYASHVQRNHGGGSFHSKLMVNGGGRVTPRDPTEWLLTLIVIALAIYSFASALDALTRVIGGGW